MQERAERREEVAAAAFHHVKRDHSTSPSLSEKDWTSWRNETP